MFCAIIVGLCCALSRLTVNVHSLRCAGAQFDICCLMGTAHMAMLYNVQSFGTKPAHGTSHCFAAMATLCASFPVDHVMQYGQLYKALIEQLCLLLHSSPSCFPRACNLPAIHLHESMAPQQKKYLRGTLSLPPPFSPQPPLATHAQSPCITLRPISHIQSMAFFIASRPVT